MNRFEAVGILVIDTKTGEIVKECVDDNIHTADGGCVTINFAHEEAWSWANEYNRGPQ